jgi:hypothetical protein
LAVDGHGGIVARMERSDIREPAVPHFAAINAGYSAPKKSSSALAVACGFSSGR